MPKTNTFKEIKMRDYSRQEVVEIVRSQARAKGIPEGAFLGMAAIESGFDEQARNVSGAKGLFQFMDGTARQYGIFGQQFDPRASAEAAARLYQDNVRLIERSHERTQRPYLSGDASPVGLDLYLAHQQGGGGYLSIQNALATGQFFVTNSRGEPYNTRANILQNMPDTLARVTDIDKGNLSKLDDRALAQVFVDAWKLRYSQVMERNADVLGVQQDTAAVSVGPNRQGQPISRSPAASEPLPGTTNGSSAQGVVLNSLYANGIKYNDVRYMMNNQRGIDGKHVSQGYVDCSGWAGTLLNDAMDEINRESGSPVFSKSDRVNLGYHNAGAIVYNASQRGGGLLIGGDVTRRGALKEGMVIGIDSGDTSHDGWRDIDHIVVVVRDPKTGQLMASQSSPSTNGVDMMPLDKYLDRAQHEGWKLYATDPLSKARDLLQDKQQTQTQGQNTPATRNASDRAPEGHNFDGVINSKDRGPAVIQVQQLLNAIGYAGPEGKPFQAKDGTYGPATAAAVKQFQEVHGLQATGEVDKQTLQALEKAKLQPLITNDNHPDNKLFDQIKAKCDAQGGAATLGLGSEREYKQALATMTYEAKVAGMTSVDHVVPSTNGQTMILMQVNPANGDQLRAVVDKQQAMQQPVEQSSYQLQQDQQRVQQLQQQGSEQQQQSQRQSTMAM